MGCEEIAREAIEGGGHWIEIGKPPYQKRGNGVQSAPLEKAFPDRTTLADMKTVWIPEPREVKMAAKAGADGNSLFWGVQTTLLLLSYALRSAHKYGGSV